VKVLYVLGILYLLVSISFLFSDVVLSSSRHVRTEVAGQQQQSALPPRPTISGNVWFEQMRTHCNAVEIDTYIHSYPAPATVDGKGYSAACFGLAGRIDDARAIINSLPLAQQSNAAGIMFGVAHPVADAGDDHSAGPMMRLTIEYQPSNFMALYHAGISEHILGQNDLSRQHLAKFLELYKEDDYYSRKAKDVLASLQQ
jgi:hypothetical protein